MSLSNQSSYLASGSQKRQGWVRFGQTCRAQKNKWEQPVLLLPLERDGCSIPIFSLRQQPKPGNSKAQASLGNFWSRRGFVADAKGRILLRHLVVLVSNQGHKPPRASVGLVSPSSSQDPAAGEGCRWVCAVVPFPSCPPAPRRGQVIPVKPSCETYFLSLQVRTGW